MAGQQIAKALNKDVAHASQFTSGALATFARATTITTEAISGTMGAFIGGGGAWAIGVAHPAFASAWFDLCGFGGVGCATFLIARFLKARNRGLSEDDRRTDLAFRARDTELLLQTLERLPTNVSAEMTNLYALEALAASRPLLPDASSKPERSDVERAVSQARAALRSS